MRPGSSSIVELMPNQCISSSSGMIFAKHAMNKKITIIRKKCIIRIGDIGLVANTGNIRQFMIVY